MLAAESPDLHYGFGGALVEFDDLELYENSARLTVSFATVRDWDNAHWTMYRIRLHRFPARWRIVDRISTSYGHGPLLMESGSGTLGFEKGVDCARGDCSVRVRGLVIHVLDVEFIAW